MQNTRAIILSYILSLFNSFHKRLFSLSCLGVQVVFDYKIYLLETIGICGAFLASSDFLVYVKFTPDLKTASSRNKHILLKNKFSQVKLVIWCITCHKICRKLIFLFQMQLFISKPQSELWDISLQAGGCSAVPTVRICNRPFIFHRGWGIVNLSFSLVCILIRWFSLKIHNHTFTAI